MVFFLFGMLLLQWKTWRIIILTSKIDQDKVKEKITSYFTSFIHRRLQTGVLLMCIHNNFPMPKCELLKSSIWMKILIPFRFFFLTNAWFYTTSYFTLVTQVQEVQRSSQISIQKNWNSGPSLKLLHFICNPVVV